MDHRRNVTTFERSMRLVTALILVMSAWMGAVATATARSVDPGNPGIYTLHLRANTGDMGTAFGARFTVTSEDDEVLGSCTLEGDASSPPYQYCTVDVPDGLTVSVRQDPDSIPAGYAPVENPITFDTRFPTTTPHQIDVFFDNQPNLSSASQGDDVPLAISAKTCGGSGSPGSCWNEIGAQFTVATEDGEYLDSCTLEGYRDRSIIAVCQVTVPRGITVVVTEDVSTITSGYAPEENPIYFLAEPPRDIPTPWGPSFTNLPIGGSVSTGETSDLAIVTTEGGQSVTDACYILVGYGNEGYDENGDGQITYQDVPLGTYTVRQTADLGPGRSVADFTIDVTGAVDSSGYERFAASVVSGGGSGSATAGGPIDIALITRDPETGDLLTRTCYVLVGFSNEGCDENGDGQVTFAAVPPDAYTVRQTQTPVGYPTIDDYTISVGAVDGFPDRGPIDVPLGFVVRQAEEQNAPDTRNVSVVLLDARTHERVSAGICVELVGASNVGCDEDLVDGQVDFLGVPAGGAYELRFSDLPAGYEVGAFDEDRAVVVDAGPTAPTNQMVFVELVRTDGGAITGPGGAAGGPMRFDELLGDWFTRQSTLSLDADGTGFLSVGDGCCTRVEYTLSFDPGSEAGTLTVLDRDFPVVEGWDPYDADAAARPGDTITVEVSQGESGTLLVLHIPWRGGPDTLDRHYCREGNTEEACELQ